MSEDKKNKNKIKKKHREPDTFTHDEAHEVIEKINARLKKDGLITKEGMEAEYQVIFTPPDGFEAVHEDGQNLTFMVAKVGKGAYQITEVES